MIHADDYSPVPEEFNKRAHKARLIPVYCQIISDLDTPLTLFSKIHQGREHVFLFESMEGGEKWGRYSFIGFDPLVTFVSNDDRVELFSGRRRFNTFQRQFTNTIKKNKKKPPGLIYRPGGLV